VLALVIFGAVDAAASAVTPAMEEGYLVVRYLYEQRPDGRYIPTVSVQLLGKADATIIILKAGFTRPQ
jgi:hypothetical protein